MKPLRPFLALALCSAAFAAPASAADAPAPSAPPKRFLYVLRLVPRLHDDKAWTEADGAVIGRHFNHLKAATERGQVILAGRTDEPGDRTFGLVIFEAPDAEAATAFMQGDPAVAEGIMTATLHPYSLALLRKP